MNRGLPAGEERKLNIHSLSLEAGVPSVSEEDSGKSFAPFPGSLPPYGKGSGAGSIPTSSVPPAWPVPTSAPVAPVPLSGPVSPSAPVSSVSASDPMPPLLPYVVSEGAVPPPSQ